MAELCELINSGGEFNLDEMDGEPVLLYAAKNNLPVVVKRLSDAGLDSNITDDKGKTPLFYANRNHSMDALCELISWGAKFKLDDIDGKAVLFYAAENDYFGVVDKLHFKNFDLNITDDEGKTALFYANRNHSMDVLCELIRCDAEFKLDQIDGKAVLFYAAENDYFGVVDKLHFKNFDLNITDNEGKTALFYANRNHSVDVLCELISWGTKFKLDDIDGKAVLFYAAENDYFGVVDKLHFKNFDLNITDDEGKTALFYANRNHSMDALCDLISWDAKFKLDDIDGKAVLFYAAENDYFGVMDKLHFKNFDLNITDDEGKTALFYANRNHSMDALCELISWGAKFKLDDIDGKAVLFYAAQNNYFGVVDKLHFKNFDLNITDDEGKTALFYANRNHSMDALCELISWGAKFKLDDIDGKAVLFYAAENDYFGVMDKLHFKNFDLNITDDEGKTALFYANRNHSMDALCELISWGAKFKLDDIDGKAVLFYAAQNNYFGVVDKLHFKNFDLNLTDDEGKTALFYANRYHRMDVLCELIRWGAEFRLDDINGKAVLFYAANEGYKHVVKPLYNVGLDVNVTDEQGKTVVFYGGQDFLDALMEAGEVFMDARDHCGRTPLFYALQCNDTRKARYLIEKGANLQLKDNCNVSIFIFFIETCISKNLEAMDLYTSQLFQEEPQRKALTHAIFNILYCQAPLLSLRSFPYLLEPYAIFNETNVLGALAFAREEYVNQDSHKVENIDKVVQMIREKVTDVPRIISLLINLGADPQTTDSEGNTAFHYATLLPLNGVTQEVVMDMCKKLKRFGTIFHAKNHQHQSPLLFCLSSSTWKVVTENNSWQSSIRGLVEVCRFLLSSRNVIIKSELIFHRIITLIQQGLKLNKEPQRKAVVQVLVDVLELLPPNEEAVTGAVNDIDNLLNSPLHLWASIALKTPQDYSRSGTKDFTFEDILKRILDHLLKCGAKCNARNADEETPLHTCRTWTAVKLLLDAGANPKDQDSSGYSPLLTAAKKKNASQKTEHLYPDVTEKPESFWKYALQKGLDPWVAGKQGETILSVLVKSEDFALTRALVEVACKEESTTDNVKLSILNVICQDESKHTHWKTILVDIILKSARTSRLALESPLRLCCRNIVKFGMFDAQPVSIQSTVSDKSSDDDGQPSPKKRRKDESAKDQESNEKQVNYDSVYCKIAKQVVLYGVDIHNPDQSGICCLDIANDCPSLQDLLTKPIEIDTVPILIPWLSVSDKSKGLLAKVARRRECKIVNQIWYHRQHIGSGSFGHIFAGINEKDGREVAVKRVEKLRLKRPEDKREIENLIALSDCEHVVRYISFFEDEDFSYVVLELMEGNLEEFFDGYTITAELTCLCKDVVMGLQFLHEQKILHRDLKPQNILYKVHPKLCLKIADFGLSRTVDSECTTVYGTVAGTRCWIAPEVLKSKKHGVDPISFAQASDVFSCGILLHYILSARKHPFNPADCANKNELQVSHETEANIMNDKMDGWDNSLCPEATHLVKKMLENNKEDRPSASKALEHPLFWSNKRKVNFLKAASSHEKFRKEHDPNIEAALKNSMERGRWNNKNKYKHMSKLHMEMSKVREYHVRSVVDLVRLIRNVYEHWTEISLDESVQTEKLLFTDNVFFENFPHLVMEVYKYVTEHNLDEAAEIKSAMDKEY